MSVAVDLDSSRVSTRLWTFAAAAAISAHVVGVAVGLITLRSDEGDEGLGVNAIEVGLQLESSHAPETDLPAGPDSEASSASPAVMEQKAEVKEADLPKAVPNEAEEPDRVVTLNDSKKPKDEEAEKAVVQQSASTESVAADATARQSFEGAKESERQAAQNLGLSRKDQKLIENWYKKISAYFELHKVYSAKEVKQRKSVKVEFTLNRKGNVLAVSVVESSGDPEVDKAAIAMIRKSDPVPPPPVAVTDDKLTNVIRVDFNPPKK